MKKQHKTYVLLGIVLCVWGLIGFQVIKAINPEEANPGQPMTMAKFSRPKVKEKQSFSINANYRDPFLGTLPKRKKVLRETAKIAKPINWPSIDYLGTMGAKGNKNQLYFLNINGQQQMLRKGDVVADVKLLSGTKEGVKLRYKGEVRTIAKQ